MKPLYRDIRLMHSTSLKLASETSLLADMSLAGMQISFREMSHSFLDMAKLLGVYGDITGNFFHDKSHAPILQNEHPVFLEPSKEAA